jgi:hypothetical protein
MTEFGRHGLVNQNLKIPANLANFPRSLKQIIQGRLHQTPNAVNTTANPLFVTGERNLNSMIAMYESMYHLRKPSKIRVFLEDNEFLDPIITEAYGKLQKHFPSSAIFMEVVQNELVISIGTTLSPEDADEKLDSFDEEWWIDASARSNARLCITVEFQ